MHTRVIVVLLPLPLAQHMPTNDLVWLDEDGVGGVTEHVREVIFVIRARVILWMRLTVSMVVNEIEMIKKMACTCVRPFMHSLVYACIYISSNMMPTKCCLLYAQ